MKILFQNFSDTVQIHSAESIRKSANGLPTSVPLPTLEGIQHWAERLLEVGEPFVDFGILFKVNEWVVDFKFLGDRTALG